ncbi:TauD/TfdA dioxygenase family protein [Prauserella rugosa]|uniref:Alpha-ketoglutarate-dependent sulfate ester dioxygenase n=1 Tax=Prauserella rugosa TaxID=43354 RepID=A0A660CBE1_9PSEU|nr:TauD/TfdA family dioxygenase [Prauserella rugosa]KMS82780.1 hypothetical protein ACZ91_56735 [Streptomyces regensis]TWH20792.1 taurine dioxygenase [Prauserella rugosa]
MTASQTNVIDIQPVAGSLGAEITGVELRPDSSDDVVALVRQAILEHKVVFVRGQDHLDDDLQAGFARRLGELTTAHPTVPGAESNTNVLPVDAERGNRANSWHHDVTFVQAPPSFSLLRAIVLPPYGGDTAWANTVSAYESLPDSLKQLAEQLWAVHTNDYDYSASHAVAAVTEQAKRYREQFTSTVYRTEHPVVRIHPETGEKTLLLGHFAQKFAGYNGSDSRHLFEILQNHVSRLENTVRWRWAPGDIAIWDNRLTQHYAVSDFGDTPRRLHRVTVAGDVPVSVDGRSSVPLQGDASAYTPA